MNLLKKLQVQQGDSSLANGVESNVDLDPVPLHSPSRTWRWPSLTGFWIAEAFSISMYQGMIILIWQTFANLSVTSTSVSKGLSAPMAIGAVIVGHVLVCIPVILDGFVSSLFLALLMR